MRTMVKFRDDEKTIEGAGKSNCFLKTSEYMDINGRDTRHWQ